MHASKFCQARGLASCSDLRDVWMTKSRSRCNFSAERSAAHALIFRNSSSGILATYRFSGPAFASCPPESIAKTEPQARHSSLPGAQAIGTTSVAKRFLRSIARSGFLLKS
eukprot:5933587-Pleurochrysis_carterae.AAC.2